MANPTPPEANASEGFFVSRNKARSSLSMSFSNVTQLTGRDTYDTWAAIMDAIWYSQQLGEMVIEGKKPEKDASPEETEAYMLLSKYAITVFVQVVSPQVLTAVIQLRDPHLMWTHLQTQFH